MRDADWVRFEAYSGQEVVGRLRVARSEHDIVMHLREARAKRLTVSFRGGEMAFDTHALNSGMVIQLDGFDAVGDVVDGTITVGAHATWGTILEKTRAVGHVPYVMVSTEFATAGGTLSADCLSRFSPTCGKEGNHVVSFRLMKLDGRVVVCSRRENVELFRGVISGFGYLGCVLEVTYRLLDVGTPNIVVETSFTPFEGLRGLADALVTEVDAARSALRPEDTAPTSLAPLENVGVDDAHAVSAVVFMNDRRQGFVMRSRYVDGAHTPLDPSPFHEPQSWKQRALQVLAFFEPARELGYVILLDTYLKKPRKAVDSLEGFTFFQGGNDAVRRAGRKLGLPMGIRQQTYVIPRDPSDPAKTTQALSGFLEEADALLDARGIVPPLIDVLYLPDDSNEGFVFSSGRGGSGYAITITFEDPFRSTFPDEEAVLSEMARICERRGGRVHLVKNVFAEGAQLERMYRNGVAEMKALKAVFDPERMLSNGFLRRVFPSLARDEASSAPLGTRALR